MGDSRVQVDGKSSSTVTPGFKPQGSSFLEQRYQEQVETETTSPSDEKQLNSSEQPNPTPPPLDPPPFWHSFGRVSVCPIQAKLRIGQPGNKYEQEAERVAEQVMRMPEPKPVARRIVSPVRPVALQRQPLEETEDEKEMVKAKLSAGSVMPVIQRQGAKSEEEDKLQMKPVVGQITPVIQRQTELPEEEEDETLQAKTIPGYTLQGLNSGGEATMQRQAEAGDENRSGLPTSLRAGLEDLSGIDLSGIRVHHNSSKPAKINALAYTQGQEIHVSPGQEKHLPHEGWHVVQQMQGRVKPTIQAKGVSINDEEDLEHEADVMGQRAERFDSIPTSVSVVKPVSRWSSFTHLSILQKEDGEKDMLPEPVQVVWGGDPFTISFERKQERGGSSRFQFVIRYTGPQPVDGPSVTNKTVQVSALIGSAVIKARIHRQTDSILEIDLYGDRSQMIKLTDKVAFESRAFKYKGRRHPFHVTKNGRFAYSSSFWVLDPKATAKNVPVPEPEEVPGENPKSTLEGGGTKIIFDGDGDQYKELSAHIKSTSYWDPDSKDVAKDVTLEITQLSSKQTKFVSFQLPKPRLGGSFFPIVKEVTDGKSPTRLSLVLPIGTQLLDILPPKRTATDVEYIVEVVGQRFSFKFPPEKSPIHRVVKPGELTIRGNIASSDIELGAYGDRFRLTINPTSMTKGIFGISPLSRKGQPLGGEGVEVSISPNAESTVLFELLNTGPVSLGIDMNQDGKPDLQIFDRLTTPEAVDGGGPTESNRNHHVRVTGSAIGSDRVFYFPVRNNYFRGGIAGKTGREAAINAMAVGALTEQEAEGATFEAQIDAYEMALMPIRKKALDGGLVSPSTFTAWKDLSEAIIKLGPQIQKKVNSKLKNEAARQADKLYKALQKETSRHTKPIPTGVHGASSSTYNPYTDESITITPFSFSKFGAGPDLAKNIRAEEWEKAFPNYRKLVSGLDQWIVENLKKTKGERAEETQQAAFLAGRRRQLANIEKHNPKRLLAAFYPDKKFGKESGYVSQVPLSLYYWKHGNTWHLKDITNPEKIFHYTYSAKENDSSPPQGLLAELNDPDHFPLGVIIYQVPGQKGGRVRTTDHLTWKKFFSYLGLGLAAVGLVLSAIATSGTTLAVAGSWALAGSALATGAAAAINLAEKAGHGQLDTTTALIDLGTIVSSLAGLSALRLGKIVRGATSAAEKGKHLVGTAAQRAVLYGKYYVVASRTRTAADVVTVAAFGLDTAKKLDEIEYGPGDRKDRDRAKRLLLAQLAVTVGLEALSIKGEIPHLNNQKPLVLESIGGVTFARVGPVVKRVGKAPSGIIIKEVPIAKLNPIHDVPRAGVPKGHIEGIMGAMSKSGYDVSRPVSATKLPDGTLIITGGHHRLEAMRRLGELQVPVQIFEAARTDPVRLAQFLGIGRITGKYTGAYYPRLGPAQQTAVNTYLRKWRKANPEQVKTNFPD